MAHRVTLIPGDGTGPELTEATRRVLEATGVEFDWDVQYAGSDVMEQLRREPAARPGPRRDPGRAASRSRGRSRPRSAAASARSTSRSARPRPLRPGAAVQELSRVRSRYEDVDLVIVREATEDLYAGIEYEVGSPEATELTAGSARTAASCVTTRGSRSSRSPSKARAGSSSSPSTTRARSAAGR